MALVTNIRHQALERDSKHKKVECTYEVLTNIDTGELYLQLDSYGSDERQIKGKKSDSVFFYNISVLSG